MCGKQADKRVKCTIIWHVDYLKLSQNQAKVVDKAVKWIKYKYERYVSTVYIQNVLVQT